VSLAKIRKKQLILFNPFSQADSQVRCVLEALHIIKTVAATRKGQRFDVPEMKLRHDANG
jgi:hypothetical protein